MKKINLDISKIIEQYKNGLSTSQIAKIYDVHSSTIQDRLRRCGEIKRQGRYRVYSDDERKNRRREYDRRYNASEAAKKAHRRRCEKDRKKVRARWTVANNIKSGKISRVSTQKCFDCNNDANEYDHYLGHEYKHRLDIQAVCYICHRKREKIRNKYEKI